MRLIGGASIIAILATVLAVSGIRSRAQTGAVTATDTAGAQANSNAGRHEGKTIFRYDTFGDEQLWTDVLRMHEVLRDCRSGDGACGRPEGRRRGVAERGRRGTAGRRVDLTNPAVRSHCCG